MIRPKERPEGLKPVGGDSPKASDRTKSGSGGKGGRKDVNPSTKSGKLAITRSRGGGFGYYDDRGKYVSAFTDAIDGGGKNQSGTYFAGGPLSNILNVMKVAPKGSGDVPRERIGYRDMADMFDQGGPQASGGGFRGAGGFSGIGNIANMLTGNQSERVGYYDEGGRFYEPPVPASTGASTVNAQPSMVDPMGADYHGAFFPMGPEDFAPYPQQPAAPSYLMPSSMQMPVQQEGLGSSVEQPVGQIRQAATGLTYAPPASSAEVDFMRSELTKQGYPVSHYGDSDIKELYKLFMQ